MTTYEREIDLSHEVMAARAISDTFGVRVVKHDPFARYDFKCYDDNGDLAAVAEFKWRNISSQDYDDYGLDLGKYVDVLEAALENRCHPYLFIRYTDGVFMHKLTPKRLNTYKRGQVKRHGRPPRDGIFIPISDLRPAGFYLDDIDTPPTERTS